MGTMNPNNRAKQWAKHREELANKPTDPCEQVALAVKIRDAGTYKTIYADFEDFLRYEFGWDKETGAKNIAKWFNKCRKPVPKEIVATDRTLGELEAIIESSITTMFQNAGPALSEIHDKELYLETHNDWENYCKDRWGYSGKHGYRLIKSSKTLERVRPTGDTNMGILLNERQLRVISTAPEEHQAEIVEAVLHECSEAGREPTAKDFEKAAKPFIPAKPKKARKPKPPKPSPVAQQEPVTAPSPKTDAKDALDPKTAPQAQPDADLTVIEYPLVHTTLECRHCQEAFIVQAVIEDRFGFCSRECYRTYQLNLKDIKSPCPACDGTGKYSPEFFVDWKEAQKALADQRAKSATKQTVFKKPTVEEVEAYCLERGKGIDPQQWFDHYTSNGWVVGRSPMKDWKAAVRNWERNHFGSQNGKSDSDFDAEFPDLGEKMRREAKEQEEKEARIRVANRTV